MSGDNEGLHRDLAAGAGRPSARPSARPSVRPSARPSAPPPSVGPSGFGQSARPPSIRPGSGAPGVTGGSSPDSLSPGSGGGLSGGLMGGLSGGLFGGGPSDAPAKPARPARAARLDPGASQAGASPSTGARSGAQPGGAQPDASAQVAAVRARRAEREKAEAAAARRRDAARAAAEDAREERRVAALKRLAAGRKAAAADSGAGAGARDKAGPARLAPQGATVDARIRSLMRDPRYWRDRDRGLQDHVLRQWERAYPGTSLHAGFARPDPIPAIEPDAVEAWPPEATPLPAPHRDGPLHPRPAVINPEFVWNAETGRWERDPAHRPGRGSPSAPAPHPLTTAGANAAGANAAGAADAPGPHGGLGPNSGRTREAALDALRARAADGSMSASEFLKQAERIRQAFPEEGGADASNPDGVQVAAAPGAALPWLIGALGLGAGLGALPPGQAPGDGRDAAPPPSTRPDDPASDHPTDDAMNDWTRTGPRPEPFGFGDAPGVLENRKAKDSSKNEKHGDGGRDKPSVDQQIKDLEAQANSAPTKKEREALKRKIRKIRENRARQRRGEEHSRRPKR